MDKEKEIEEMAMSIAECNGTTCENCRPKCNKYITCEILHKNGYGNVKQAVREFAENKVKPIIDELVELLFNDDEPDCKVDNCEKGSDIPCGCSICVEENKQAWKGKIDNVIKDLYEK